MKSGERERPRSDKRRLFTERAIPANARGRRRTAKITAAHNDDDDDDNNTNNSSI